MMEGTFGDLINPVINSYVASSGDTAYFEIWRSSDDENDWGCVENNVGVWKHSDNIIVVGNAIKAYIEDNFDLSGNPTISFMGGANNDNPPTHWETLLM